jgi:hypothetical protein
MSLAPRSVAMGAALVAVIGLIAGGAEAFREYTAGRLSPVWPMWLLWLSGLVVWILITTLCPRRRPPN